MTAPSDRAVAQAFRECAGRFSNRMEWWNAKTCIESRAAEIDAQPPQQAEGISFPADYVLPCDVAVAPATKIRKGVTLGTLMKSIALREQPDTFSPGPEFRRLFDTTPQPGVMVPDGWRVFPFRNGVGVEHGNFTLNWALRPPESVAGMLFDLCKALLIGQQPAQAEGPCEHPLGDDDWGQIWEADLNFCPICGKPVVAKTGEVK